MSTPDRAEALQAAPETTVDRSEATSPSKENATLSLQQILMNGVGNARRGWDPHEVWRTRVKRPTERSV